MARRRKSLPPRNANGTFKKSRKRKPAKKKTTKRNPSAASLKKTRTFAGRRFTRVRLAPFKTKREAEARAKSIRNTRHARVTKCAGGYMVWSGRLK